MKAFQISFINEATHEDGLRLGRLVSQHKALPEAAYNDLILLRNDGGTGDLNPPAEFLQGLETGMARYDEKSERRSKIMSRVRREKKEWKAPPTAAERNPEAHKRAMELRSEGKTLREIGETLHQEGLHATKKGEPLSAPAVRRLLGLIRGA